MPVKTFSHGGRFVWNDQGETANVHSPPAIPMRTARWPRWRYPQSALE